jgi:hypothetical protein
MKFKVTFDKIKENEIVVEADNEVQALSRAKAKRMEQVTPKTYRIEEIRE